MGASGWHYFTPYQPDVGKALAELRQQVFARGEYGAWRRVEIMSDAELAALPSTLREQFTALRAHERAKRAAAPEPRTIEEAIERAGEDGTHSVLDIFNGVADRPAFAAAFPMPDGLKLRRYETVRPTRTQIEAADQTGDAEYHLERWQCWYAIVYEGDRPSEIYFEGCSGD